MQNPKIAIPIIVVAALAIIGIIVMFFGGFGGGDQSAGPVDTPVMLDPNGGGMTLTDAASAGAGPGIPGGGPGMPGAPAVGGLTPTMPGAAGNPAAPAPAGAAAGKADTKPGLPRGDFGRGNPFAETREITSVLDSEVAERQPEYLAPPQNIYAELYEPKPDEGVTVGEDDQGGPAVPTMRVAGMVEGSQIAAVLQIGSQYMTVTPGKMVPEGNPVYRVDRVEKDKIFLSRRWETGGRKGVQRIEVGLRGSPEMGNPYLAAGGGPMGAGPGGMPGPGALPGPGAPAAAGGPGGY
ncbi:MAG: hypothetical protein ACK47B_00820 [Armatimonadota bacterium]